MIRKLLEILGLISGPHSSEIFIRPRSHEVLDGITLTIALSRRRDWKKGLI